MAAPVASPIISWRDRIGEGLFKTSIWFLANIFFSLFPIFIDIYQSRHANALDITVFKPPEWLIVSAAVCADALASMLCANLKKPVSRLMVSYVGVCIVIILISSVYYGLTKSQAQLADPYGTSIVFSMSLIVGFVGKLHS